MEKLIELLNEYEKVREMEIWTFELGKIPYREWSLDMWDLVFEPNYKDKKYEDCIWDTANSVLISKSFWFIKWLVENDKIDREQFYDKARNIITDFDLRWEYEWGCNEIIMLLSISDTPIEDLISYLHE
jgi:hypothetical protein